MRVGLRYRSAVLVLSMRRRVGHCVVAYLATIGPLIASPKAPSTTLPGRMVRPGQLPEFRGLLRSQDGDDLLFRGVERRVNARLHFVPRGLDVLLMPRENPVDGVLLGRTELELAGEPLRKRMGVGCDAFMAVVLPPLVQNPG